MARMQQVEASVREDDRLARQAPPVHFGDQVLAVEHLRLLGMMMIDQVAKISSSVQEGDAELFDLEAAGDVPSSAASS